MKTEKQIVKERRRRAEFFSKAQRIDELLAEIKTPPNTPRSEEEQKPHSSKPQKR